jgi:NH3-dependent NAD+ synthetase
MKRCKRCLLPSAGINVLVDPEGICNHCRTYEKLRARLTDFERLRSLLEDRLERLRGKQRYDCLVGVSGGKDSSYVAYAAARIHGLRALAVTYDNGFLSAAARENIRRVVDALGLEHRMVTVDPEIQQAIYRSSLKRFGLPCIGCTFPGMASLLRLAIDEGIPIILHGRSRAQMFKELAPGNRDPFLPFVLGNLKACDGPANKAFMVDAAERLTRFVSSLVPERRLQARLREAVLPDMRRLREAENAPESVAYFLYGPYDEDRIMAVLEREAGWRRPESGTHFDHHDCTVHDAATHLYNRIYFQPMVGQELSVMIREGNISRQEAWQRLEKETFVARYPSHAMEIIRQMTGFSAAQVGWSAARARWFMRLFGWFCRLSRKIRTPAPVLLE